MKQNKCWMEIKQKGHFCPTLVLFYVFWGMCYFCKYSGYFNPFNQVILWNCIFSLPTSRGILSVSIFFFIVHFNFIQGSGWTFHLFFWNFVFLFFLKRECVFFNHSQITFFFLFYLFYFSKIGFFWTTSRKHIYFVCLSFHKLIFFGIKAKNDLFIYLFSWNYIHKKFFIFIIIFINSTMINRENKQK